MGIANSRQTTLETSELQDFADMTNLQYEDVQHLYKLFKTISSLHKDDGVIDQQELHLAFRNKSVDSSQMVFKYLDLNNDAVLNFREFVIGLSTFLGQTQPVQIKFLFSLIDYDNQNQINEDKVIGALSKFLDNFENIILTKSEINLMVKNEFDKIFDTKPCFNSSFQNFQEEEDNGIDGLSSIEKKLKGKTFEIQDNDEVQEEQPQQKFTFSEQQGLQDFSPVKRLSMKEKSLCQTDRNLNYQMFHYIMMQNEKLLQWLQIDKYQLKQAAQNLNN